MYVFIDESGDPGVRKKPGSSKFFVITMVIFQDESQVKAMEDQIRRFKGRLGLHEGTEIKFSNTKPKDRMGFFSAINPLEFSVRNLILDKSKIKNRERFSSNKGKFYRELIADLIIGNLNHIKGAKIRIDGGGEKEFRREFVNWVSRQVGRGSKLDYKVVGSKSDHMIQLTDMIAGAVNRWLHDEKKDSAWYYGCIKKHIASTQYFDDKK